MSLVPYLNRFLIGAESQVHLHFTEVGLSKVGSCSGLVTEDRLYGESVRMLCNGLCVCM